MLAFKYNDVQYVRCQTFADEIMFYLKKWSVLEIKNDSVEYYNGKFEKSDVNDVCFKEDGVTLDNDQQLLREVKRKDKDDNVLVMYVSNDESGIRDNDHPAHDKYLNKPIDEETIRQEFKSLKDDKKVKNIEKKDNYPTTHDKDLNKNHTDEETIQQEFKSLKMIRRIKRFKKDNDPTAHDKNLNKPIDK